MRSSGHCRFDSGGGIGVVGIGQRAQRRGVPVWLHDVDPLTIAHAMHAADDVWQLDRVICQRGQRALQPRAFGRIRCVVVDRFIGGQGYIGDRVHVLRMTAAGPPRLG